MNPAAVRPADPGSAPTPDRKPYEEERHPARSVLSLLLFVLFLLATFREPLLLYVGRWLVVSDRVVKSDLIVVLSGDAAARAPEGAALYRKGLAPRLLVTGKLVPSALRSLGIHLTSAEVTAKGLERSGVPRSAIVVETSTGTSTWEEATFTRRYLTQHNLRSVIVVTSKFHTRRSKLAFQHALKKTGVRVQVVASHFDPVRVAGWWTREKELIQVNNEYLKLLFYAVKYF